MRTSPPRVFIFYYSYHEKSFQLGVYKKWEFPNKFPNRKLKSSGKTVRQHDELIEYIMEKAREVNLLKHTSNSNKTMVYVVKEQTIDTIPGPCNVAIYGKYYVKEKV